MSEDATRAVMTPTTTPNTEPPSQERVARVMFGDAASMIRINPSVSLDDKLTLWVASHGFGEYTYERSIALGRSMTEDHKSVLECVRGSDERSTKLRSLIDTAFFLAASEATHELNEQHAAELVAMYVPYIASPTYNWDNESRVLRDASVVELLSRLPTVTVIGLASGLGIRAAQGVVRVARVLRDVQPRRQIFD